MKSDLLLKFKQKIISKVIWSSTFNKIPSNEFILFLANELIFLPCEESLTRNCARLAVEEFLVDNHISVKIRSIFCSILGVQFF